MRGKYRELMAQVETQAEADFTSFPPPADLEKYEPEQLGMLILRHLCAQGFRGNRGNFIILFRQFCSDKVDGDTQTMAAQVMSESWMWLEREGLVAPDPDSDHRDRDWVFVTRRGRKLNESGDPGSLSG